MRHNGQTRAAKARALYNSGHMSASENTPQKPSSPRHRPAGSKPSPAVPPVRNPLPPVTFPEELPVSGKRDDIAKAIREHQVVIVSGETGSGKTTQLPRSEEHTSELQSRENLVCRLLLEKK